MLNYAPACFFNSSRSIFLITGTAVSLLMLVVLALETVLFFFSFLFNLVTAIVLKIRIESAKIYFFLIIEKFF